MSLRGRLMTWTLDISARFICLKGRFTQIRNKTYFSFLCSHSSSVAQYIWAFSVGHGAKKKNRKKNRNRCVLNMNDPHDEPSAFSVGSSSNKNSTVRVCGLSRHVAVEFEVCRRSAFGTHKEIHSFSKCWRKTGISTLG